MRGPRAYVKAGYGVRRREQVRSRHWDSSLSGKWPGGNEYSANNRADSIFNREGRTASEHGKKTQNVVSELVKKTKLVATFASEICTAQVFLFAYNIFYLKMISYENLCP